MPCIIYIIDVYIVVCISLYFPSDAAAFFAHLKVGYEQSVWLGEDVTAPLETFGGSVLVQGEDNTGLI
jgi:hypothetical protein